MKPIKNLTQLKKALKAGHHFRIVDHIRKGCIGEERKPLSVQTNAFYSANAQMTQEEIDTRYGGEGLRFDFGKASDWKFENGLCTLEGVWTIQVI